MRRVRLRRTRRPWATEQERRWKEPRWGRCRVCGAWGRILRHHVVYRQHVRRAGGDEWALTNSLDVGALGVCDCHARHHSGAARIPVSVLPPQAVDFARRLLGEAAAEVYMRRYYGGDRRDDERS